MASFSHLSSHHSPSPLPLTTPKSDPTHPSSHHSPLSLLFTPLTPIHTNALPPLPHYSSLLPLTTSDILSPLPLLLPLATPHHPSPPLTTPHHPSPPLTTPHHPSPPLTTPHHPSPPLTTPHHPSPPLLTYPPHHTSSPPSSPLSSSPTFLTTHLRCVVRKVPPLTTPHHPSPPLTTPHHPSPPLTTPHHPSPPLTTPHHPSPPLTTPPHLPSSPHLFTTLFTPHPTTLKRNIITPKDSSFLIIFYKIDQKFEFDGGGDAHVRNCARAMSSIHFSTCNILPLKKTLISHFRVLFVFN